MGGVDDIGKVRRASGKRLAELLARAVRGVLESTPDDGAAVTLGIAVEDVRRWRADLGVGPVGVELDKAPGAPVASAVTLDIGAVSARMADTDGDGRPDAGAVALTWDGRRWGPPGRAAR